MVQKLFSKIDYKNNKIYILYFIMEVTKIEKQYIASLNEKEKKAYEIAKNHLGSTFHLVKSNGFIQWKKKVSTSNV